MPLQFLKVLSVRLLNFATELMGVQPFRELTRCRLLYFLWPSLSQPTSNAKGPSGAERCVALLCQISELCGEELQRELEKRLGRKGVPLIDTLWAAFLDAQEQADGIPLCIKAAADKAAEDLVRGKVCAAYLLDAKRVVHCCRTMPLPLLCIFQHSFHERGV